VRLESVTCQQEAPPLILLGTSAPPSCVPAAVVFIAFGNYYDLLYCYYYLYYIMTIYYYDHYCVSLLTPCVCAAVATTCSALKSFVSEREKRGRTQPCPLLWPAVRHRGRRKTSKTKRQRRNALPRFTPPLPPLLQGSAAPGRVLVKGPSGRWPCRTSSLVPIVAA
jgi:hypothetical protein